MTIDRPWADLPNAKYIDAVLADVKARPAVWAKALDVALGVPYSTTRPKIWEEIVHVVRAMGGKRGTMSNSVRLWADSRCTIWRAATYTPRYGALKLVRKTVDKVAKDAAWGAAWDTVMALVIWDSSADLLDLPPDALRTMIDLAPEPVCHQAALLLPWAIARSNT